MNVTDLLLNDHCKIERSIGSFIDSLGKEESYNNIENLLWQIEKHIFIEERVIFTFLRKTDKEDYKSIPELEREHDEILRIMDDINLNLIDKKDQVVLELVKDMKKIILNHKKFEEEKIYPKLDVELSEEQKNIILGRINDIKLN